MIVCLHADNVPLQDALLQFVSTVLILDHPRLCKPLRTNIMVIKVSSQTVQCVKLLLLQTLNVLHALIVPSDLLGSDSEEELENVP